LEKKGSIVVEKHTNYGDSKLKISTKVSKEIITLLLKYKHPIPESVTIYKLYEEHLLT